MDSTLLQQSKFKDFNKPDSCPNTFIEPGVEDDDEVIVIISGQKVPAKINL